MGSLGPLVDWSVRCWYDSSFMSLGAGGRRTRPRCPVVFRKLSVGSWDCGLGAVDFVQRLLPESNREGVDGHRPQDDLLTQMYHNSKKAGGPAGGRWAQPPHRRHQPRRHAVSLILASLSRKRRGWSQTMSHGGGRWAAKQRSEPNTSRPCVTAVMFFMLVTHFVTAELDRIAACASQAKPLTARTPTSCT